MIPKIIHMIWIGPKTPPQWCIDSWKLNYISKLELKRLAGEYNNSAYGHYLMKLINS